ncbi:heparanase-like protein 3 [Dorcoceras hygrometricum]|uniref:Heparanase-like protein 3 n=1 Tax=Dorcoceras hygrometricum TaxID=472368 RepID=A0A2Z7C1W2_9LAMI|nr:heparanase-like protein 3 [Dorcoceras hygrometricum]
MKRRRAGESTDGLALMTSLVTSLQSADGLREQSQESAAFCSRAKDSADALCVEIQQSQDTSWKHMFNTSWTTRRKQQQHLVESFNEPAVAMNPVAIFAYPVDLDSQTQEKRKTHLNGKNFVSNGLNLNRGFICEESAIEEIRLRDCEAEGVRVVIAQKRKSIVDNNRGKLNLK